MREKQRWLSAMSALAAWLVSVPAPAADRVFLGAERIMGAYSVRQTTEIEEAGVKQKTSLHTTSVGVFGLRGLSGATVPRLAFDYFVTDAVSVGGNFVVTTYSLSSVFSAEGNAQEQEDDLGGGSLLVFAPRAGYRLEFSDSFGLWPRAGLLIASQKQEVVLDQQTNTRNKQSRTTLSLSLDAMFYARPVENLALMAGPLVDIGGLAGSYSDKTGNTTNAEGDASLTAFGFSFGIGAFF